MRIYMYMYIYIYLYIYIYICMYRYTNIYLKGYASGADLLGRSSVFQVSISGSFVPRGGSWFAGPAWEMQFVSGELQELNI